MIYRMLFVFSLFLIAGCGPDFYPEKPVSERVDTLDYENPPYEDFLNQLPCETEVNYRERIIPTGGGCELYVREMGAGDPILFLHGGWGHELEPLYWSFRHFADDHRLIFYDQRGSLRSQCKSSEAISVEKHVEDLKRVKDTLGLEETQIVAHSMGGYLAQRYLNDHGHERISGMLLLGTMPAEFSMGDWMPMQQAGEARIRTPEAVKTFEEAGLDSAIQADYTDKEQSRWGLIAQAGVNLHDISRWPYFRGALGFQPSAGQRAALTMEENFSCPGFLENICLYIDFRFFRDWDFREAIGGADFPVYYIHGDDDFLDLKAHIEVMEEAPNTYLKVIPNAGHLIWVDQPEVITDLMEELLKEEN